MRDLIYREGAYEAPQRAELDDPREARLKRIEDKLDMIWEWWVFERDREDRRYEKILQRVKL